jgi:hypothetical protein
MPAHFDKVYAIADQQGWKIGETVERALDALERELDKGPELTKCLDFAPKRTNHELRRIGRVPERAESVMVSLAGRLLQIQRAPAKRRSAVPSASSAAP